MDYSEVPRLRRRLAGKSTPIEKLAMSKCDYYFSHNRKFVLPLHVSWSNSRVKLISTANTAEKVFLTYEIS